MKTLEHWVTEVVRARVPYLYPLNARVPQVNTISTGVSILRALPLTENAAQTTAKAGQTLES